MELAHAKILEHYRNSAVQNEIVEFCRGRWVGVQCEQTDACGKRFLIRYFNREKTPLKIEKTSDIERIFSAISPFKIRTIYATANVYSRLALEDDVALWQNIKACMPTWDIDNKLECWNATVQAVHEIISMLESNGITRSFFIKFSGRGAHVHIHPYAISEDVRLKHNPLDLAWATVEYIREKTVQKIIDISVKYNAENLKVENEMDIQRLFICPLSIHRENLKVAVCIDPNKIDEFHPEHNANLGSFAHYKEWKNYVVGEADDLASKAYQYMGGFPFQSKRKRRKYPPVDKQILKWLKSE